jgi:DNA-binding CsgD family transcriptional regulator
MGPMATLAPTPRLHVFTKLGISSRAQLAAEAARRRS